jgi:hypothetical protein
VGVRSVRGQQEALHIGAGLATISQVEEGGWIVILKAALLVLRPEGSLKVSGFYFQ